MQMGPEFHDYSIYISHSPEDTPMVQAMVRAINSIGLSAWPPIVPKQHTKKWAERVEKAIKNSETFLFLMTPNTKFSNWMYFELGAAVGRTMYGWSISIRPLLVGDVAHKSLPPFLRQGQPIWLELGSPEDTAERLAESLMKAGTSAAT